MSFILSLILLCGGAIFVAADLQCTQIPGNLNQIDAGAGQVYGVDNNGNVFSVVNNSLQQVPGQLIHVSVGPAGVWGVNSANNIFKFQNNQWKSITGLLNQVDAGGNIFLVGVGTDNSVYCLKQSCTTSKASIVTFTTVGGRLKYYSCGPAGCWGVNNANNIFFRQNVSPEACQGSQWQQVDGRLLMVEVGTDGSVYGVNEVGNSFRRDGITASNPIGTVWTLLEFCATFKHITYDAGYIWLLSQAGDIYSCSYQN
ncbi:fish-egg lectin-like [Anomaloglossus baeobatrachus]|uniref:fish-egg lectin-like n=1 Tax=Anomaloglossus baeobatrachus TaxID=238106 RepID=UPI003F4F7596